MTLAYPGDYVKVHNIDEDREFRVQNRWEYGVVILIPKLPAHWETALVREGDYVVTKTKDIPDECFSLWSVFKSYFRLNIN